MNNNNEDRKKHVESLFLQFLNQSPEASLFTSEDVLGDNPQRGDKHLLSHILKDRGYHQHLSPAGRLWSNKYPQKWINPRRTELEKKIDEYIALENPEEIITQSFLERFYPTHILSRRSDKHLLARILGEKGWVRKIEAMPSVRKTKSQMARVWIKLRERKRNNLPM